MSSKRIVTECLTEEYGRQDYEMVCIPEGDEALKDYIEKDRLWIDDRQYLFVNPWRPVAEGESTNGWLRIEPDGRWDGK